MQNEITIQFKPDGDQLLVNAIKALDKATKNLLNTQAKIVDFNKKSEASEKKVKASKKSHEVLLLGLNYQLKKQGANLKDVAVKSELYKKASDGDRVAIKKLRIAVSEHIDSLRKQRMAIEKQSIATEKQRNISRKLYIEIKKNGIKSFKHLRLETGVLTRAFKGNAVAIRKVRAEMMRLAIQQGTAGKGMMDTAHSTRILGGAFAVLRSKLLLVSFAMSLGIRQLIRMVSEATKVDAMETAFNTLAGSTESYSIALGKLKKATNNTMSDFDLFQQANNAMILGITKNSDEMAEMFDIAQRLGRALGRDTASAVESLITGIGRQSRLMLDNIGIIVKADQAYESYAEKLGIAEDKLSDADRKQAFLNATMEAARSKVQALGDEQLATRDTLDELGASSQNLATALGTALAPLFEKMSKHTSSWIQDLTELINFATKAKSTNLKFAEATEAGEKALETYGKKFEFTADKTKSLSDNLKDLQDAVGMKNQTVFLRLKALIEKLIDKQHAYNVVATSDKVSEEMKKKLAIQEKDIELAKKNAEAVKKAFTERLEQLTSMNFTEEQAQKKQEEWANKNKKAKEDQLKLEKDIAAFQKQLDQENLAAFKEIATAQAEIYKDNLEFQFLQIDLQADKFRAMQLDGLAITEFVEQAKHDVVIKNLEKTNIAYNSFLAGYDTFIRSMTDMDMHGAERRKQVLEATKNAFIGFLGEMIKEKIKQIIAEQIISKASQASSIVSAKATGALIASAYAVPAALASTASFGQAATAGTAGVMASIAAVKAMAEAEKLEEGGLIGGRRHSQGGTLIEAEQGEFIIKRDIVEKFGLPAMNAINSGDTELIKEKVEKFEKGGLVQQYYNSSKEVYEKGGLVEIFKEGGLVTNNVNNDRRTVTPHKAVQSIAIEAMNQINQGNSPNQITVNINGGIVQDDYVRNELIPALNKATSLGTRVNA